MKWIAQHWNNFWFSPASADNLGLCRVIFYGSMLLFYLLTPLLFPTWGWHENFSDWGKVSLVFWQPIWLFAQFHIPRFSIELLTAIELTWRISLALSCIGLFTRLSTAVSFILGIYLFGLPNSFGKTHHLDILMVFCFLILAFSRCGDAWSVDCLIRKAGHGSLARSRTLSGEYTWPVRAIWVVTSLVLFAAGFSKLRHSGLQWITGDTMAIFLIQANYHVTDAEPLTSWGLNLAQYTRLSHLLAAAAVMLEITFPIALFSRRARWFIVPSGALMQLGIAALLGPNFYQMMLCYSLWVPWDRVAARLKKQHGNQNKYVLLFDGGCGLCDRTVAIISSLDLLGCVEFCDVVKQRPEIEKRFPHLRQDQWLTHMHVITPGGRVRVGFDSYRTLARVLPLGWLVLPGLYLPGVSVAGSRIYRAVASRRHRGACPLPGSAFPDGSQSGKNLEASYTQQEPTTSGASLASWGETERASKRKIGS
jgi:predicted DCC family thiol-disulfide oxidoreductase YuxK